MSEPAVFQPAISWREAWFTWGRIAALSFGGPAGQIAVMHRILVDEKKWIDEERFLHALNYCMLLPGPEAQQLCVYIGWLLQGLRGALLAGILFVLPGFVSILVLSLLYAEYGESFWLKSMFFGLKPAVMVIVFEAVQRIGKRVLKNRVMVAFMLLAFILICFFDAPYPAIIGGAGLLGWLGGHYFPEAFVVLKGHGSPHSTTDVLSQRDAARQRPTLARAVMVSAICLTLWFTPIIAVAFWFGPESVYVHEGLFFSKAAVVTFGGAYSVLSYIAQQAVETYHWLQPTEMLDGLGMAETTPGPLIMVVQFVGFMGAYRNPGTFPPWLAGCLGAILTTWVTFVPCFYWIFLGAPYIERLRGNKLLGAALSAITACVVGVILNLALWFAVHTLFRDVQTLHWGLARTLWPRIDSLDGRSLLISVVAMTLTFYAKQNLFVVLAVSVGLGLLLLSVYPN